MAEKKHPVMQPVYLGMGSPMPTPRVKENSMFGKVEDAFSGRSLQFEEEDKAKLKTKDDKKTVAKEADEKTEDEKTEDKKAEEEKTEDIAVSGDKKDDDAATAEEVMKSEASSVVTCHDDTVSLLYSPYTSFILLHNLHPSLSFLFYVV